MSAAVEPALVTAPHSALVWRFDQPIELISSAAVGGGIGRVDWIVNVGVGSGYARIDLDAHAAEVAAELSLRGNGTALFTAVDAERCATAECDGVVVHATVGVSKPTWAAEAGFPVTAPGETLGLDRPASHLAGGDSTDEHNIGTINIVAQLPVGLEPGAAVNAVMTITEAKTQALAECGIAGTGTATDAVVVAWPADGHRERFGGPRSEWGQRLAVAAHAAVRDGLTVRDGA
ncbi:adenosylcobinamide amidohydrolase [Candidatus Poriferisodalis sp.]|uniref:adenosylcobinamide amidohydrolase n=1 Tax=Candidatus Poriferisodalis sp. TaxID=3101277 RepID=UPI003B028294